MKGIITLGTNFKNDGRVQRTKKIILVARENLLIP